MRGQRVPRGRGSGKIETGQARKRVEIRCQQLLEFRRPGTARLVAIRMLADAVDQLVQSPWPVGGAGRGPQGEELRSIGAGGIRRNRGVKIRERQMETVAQHLKRRELADEIRIHGGADEELQHFADVLQLLEGVPRSADIP